MATDYIPSRDGDLDTWLDSYQTLVAAGPATYGLVAADATALTASYTAWHAAYLAASNLSTRNHITIAAKDAQKILTLDVFRTYSNTIRANVGVSDDAKRALGLNVHDTVPTPVPPPSTYPLLSVAGSAPLRQQIRAADSATPTRRAKPHGSTGMLLFRAVGTAPVTDPTQTEFLGFVTRAEFESNFDAADDGKIATYYARWTNGKGEMGPFSAPVSMRVAA